MYQAEVVLQQLDKRQGGYFFVKIQAEVVNAFPRQKATRLVCRLDDVVTLRCGLNHLGDGNFYIIVAGKHLKTLGKHAGDTVRVVLEEDPNPLGVDVPEVLEALLAQEDALNERYQRLTDGKKRGLIHAIASVKSIDRQVQIAVAILNGVPLRDAVRSPSL